MKHFESSASLSEKLITGVNALVCHNPDEEMGFAGKKNSALIPDIRKYTCRSILTVNSHSSRERLAVIPADCANIVKATLLQLQERLRIPNRLSQKALIPVEFAPDDSLVSALLRMEKSDLRELMSRVDCLSYTMF